MKRVFNPSNQIKSNLDTINVETIPFEFGQIYHSIITECACHNQSDSFLNGIRISWHRPSKSAAAQISSLLLLLFSTRADPNSLRFSFPLREIATQACNLLPSPSFATRHLIPTLCETLYILLRSEFPLF